MVSSTTIPVRYAASSKSMLGLSRKGCSYRAPDFGFSARINASLADVPDQRVVLYTYFFEKVFLYPKNTANDLLPFLICSEIIGEVYLF